MCLDICGVCVCLRSNYSNVIRTSPHYYVCSLPDFNTVRVGDVFYSQKQEKCTTMRAFTSVCSVVYMSAKTTIFILLNLIKKFRLGCYNRGWYSSTYSSTRCKPNVTLYNEYTAMHTTHTLTQNKGSLTDVPPLKNSSILYAN